MMRLHSLVLTLIALSHFSCTPTETNWLAEVSQIAVEQTSLIRTDAEFLSQSVETHCQQSSAQTQEAVDLAWKNARDSYKTFEVFNFGPMVEQPLRLAPKMDFWPARTDDIEALARDNFPVRAEQLSGAGTLHRGLPVIEYLFYGLSASSQEEMYCAYLVAAALDYQNNAAALANAWSPEGSNYSAVFQALEGNNQTGGYESVSEAKSEIVNRLWFTLENIRRDKLSKPAGGEDGNVSPQSVESFYAAHSLADIESNLVGVARVYQNGIAPIEKRSDFDEDFASALASARTALARVEPTLSASVENEPQLALDAADALIDLQSLIQVDMINAFGLDVRFNDADGD